MPDTVQSLDYAAATKTDIVHVFMNFTTQWKSQAFNTCLHIHTHIHMYIYLITYIHTYTPIYLLPNCNEWYERNKRMLWEIIYRRELISFGAGQFRVASSRKWYLNCHLKSESELGKKWKVFQVREPACEKALRQ